MNASDQMLKMHRLEDLDKQAQSSQIQAKVAPPEKETPSQQQQQQPPQSSFPSTEPPSSANEASPAREASLADAPRMSKTQSEHALRSLISFLPRNRKKEAKAFLRAVLAKEGVSVHKNVVMEGGKNRGHITAVLARRYLPEREEHENFYASISPGTASLTPSFTHTFTC